MKHQVGEAAKDFSPKVYLFIMYSFDFSISWLRSILRIEPKEKWLRYSCLKYFTKMSTVFWTDRVTFTICWSWIKIDIIQQMLYHCKYTSIYQQFTFFVSIIPQNKPTTLIYKPVSSSFFVLCMFACWVLLFEEVTARWQDVIFGYAN